MSTDTVETTHDAHEAHHPKDSDYVKIALILGVITAAEVGTYFVKDLSTTTLVAVLFPMMIVKFLVVVGYFMHIKFDSKVFRVVFFGGLLLAIAVYIAAALTLGFFSSNYTS
jgi:cytochrome c oxidase subunit IV